MRSHLGEKWQTPDKGRLVAQCLFHPAAPPWFNVVLPEPSINFLSPQRGAAYLWGERERAAEAVHGGFSPSHAAAPMELFTILNHCDHFLGLVYQHAHSGADKKSIEVAVRPRKVRPQSARATICRRPAKTNSLNGALSSFPCGVSSSSSCTPCGA